VTRQIQINCSPSFQKGNQQYNFSNLEFRIKEAKNNIPYCTFPESCYTDLIQIQLSSLALYTGGKKEEKTDFIIAVL
jgi:hypothetical protein